MPGCAATNQHLQEISDWPAGERSCISNHLLFLCRLGWVSHNKSKCKDKEKWQWIHHCMHYVFTAGVLQLSLPFLRFSPPRTPLPLCCVLFTITSQEPPAGRSGWGKQGGGRIQRHKWFTQEQTESKTTIWATGGLFNAVRQPKWQWCPVMWSQLWNCSVLQTGQMTGSGIHLKRARDQ